MAAKKTKKQSNKSWQGRLTADADAQTAAMLASLDVDFALWRYDIVGSIAHAEMLHKCKLISRGELAKIKSGLKSVASDLEAGKLKLRVELEDIHMVIEKALIDRIGDVGGKLHTGRSRNDQVATDLRLWARDAADNLTDAITALQTALVAKADQYAHVVMPAYTHLQRAQPTLAGHAVLAYAEMLQRDAERMADARKRMDICPLGSGAVAGTSLPLDREMTAKTLGFSDITRNSIDATSDRDFLAELCFACAMIGVHLSRWAEDWIIYSSVEFGAIELSDAYCTSSSMMPQKKNADTLELIRGKSATAIAQLTGMLTLTKGLPLAYNRDLQDDKRFAFATVAAIGQALSVAAGIVATTEFNEANIADGLDAGFLDATALAEYVTAKGVPFRTAHQIVGKLVAQAEQQGVTLAEMPLADLQAACDKIAPDVAKYLGAANVVKRYSPEGSAGAKQLRKQLAFWKKKLG
ncbi:MAG: argininosuccinate lyase [Phycisphaerae bacterium]|jgi:argininosuccinate lyase|nr:argininosuccinate lyase [Phycisphaerae bacterium]MDP7288651.1 argininosuccinate lyase [Phycisphaerae bacterium]